MKWSVTTSDTSDRDSSGTTSNTWYNFTGLTVVMPIGSWYVNYSGRLRFDGSATTAVTLNSTLSTTTNSETDSAYTTHYEERASTGAIIVVLDGRSPSVITVTSKTTYSLLAKVTSGASITRIRWEGTARKTIISITCAYL